MHLLPSMENSGITTLIQSRAASAQTCLRGCRGMVCTACTSAVLGLRSFTARLCVSKVGSADRLGSACKIQGKAKRLHGLVAVAPRLRPLSVS